MIKLINASNHRAIWMNPELIESVHETEDGTRICTHSDVEYVGESPEEVTRKILEYKLAMRFETLGAAMGITYRLAGLEASHDPA